MKDHLIMRIGLKKNKSFVGQNHSRIAASLFLRKEEPVQSFGSINDNLFIPLYYFVGPVSGFPEFEKGELRSGFHSLFQVFLAVFYPAPYFILTFGFVHYSPTSAVVVMIADENRILDFI